MKGHYIEHLERTNAEYREEIAKLKSLLTETLPYIAYGKPTGLKDKLMLEMMEVLR